MATKIKMTPEQLEAVQVLQEDVTDMAVKLGWVPVGPRGVNGTFAFDVYEHPEAGGQMKAMVPVDPDGATTFIMGSVKVSGKVAAAIFKNPTLDPAEQMAATKKTAPKRKVKAPSAAHSAAHSTVPPTDAAHPDNEPDSAAHTDAPVPPIVPPTSKKGAAHIEAAISELECVCGKKFKTVSRREDHSDDCEIANAPDELDAAEEVRVKAATAKHVKKVQAQPHRPGSIDEDAIEEVVRDLIEDSWSHFASTLTDAQILKKATNGWVFWRNRLSNRTDSAHVSASINMPPYITGAVIDDVDMRCLHFMQTGGGFRAVAVKRIENIK